MVLGTQVLLLRPVWSGEPADQSCPRALHNRPPGVCKTVVSDQILPRDSRLPGMAQGQPGAAGHTHGLAPWPPLGTLALGRNAPATGVPLQRCTGECKSHSLLYTWTIIKGKGKYPSATRHWSHLTLHWCSKGGPWRARMFPVEQGCSLYSKGVPCTSRVFLVHQGCSL